MNERWELYVRINFLLLIMFLRKKIKVLVTEMNKIKNGIAPKITSSIFKFSNPTYNLRNKKDFVPNHVKYTLVLSHFLNWVQNSGIFYLRAWKH